MARQKGGPHKLQIAGDVYGQWTVISRVGGNIWLCRCSCGTEKMVTAQSIRSGTSKSCGCTAKDWCRKHGMEGTTIYNVWAGMKQRCQNPKYHGYAGYGGRGIMVCERWQAFENFYDDMGDKPDGLSLDRIDNDGNYEPSNCRWATPKQQSRNKRTTIFVDGMSLAELAERHGLKRKVVENRYRQGYRGEHLTARALPRGKLSLRPTSG